MTLARPMTLLATLIFAASALPIAMPSIAVAQTPTAPEVPPDIQAEVDRFREMIARLDSCDVYETGSSFRAFSQSESEENLCVRMNRALHRRSLVITHALGQTLLSRAGLTTSPTSGAGQAEHTFIEPFPDGEWLRRLSRQPFGEALDYMLALLPTLQGRSSLYDGRLDFCQVHYALLDISRAPEPLFPECTIVERAEQQVLYQRWRRWRSEHQGTGPLEWTLESERLANRWLETRTEPAELNWAAKHLIEANPFRDYESVMRRLKARLPDMTHARIMRLFPELNISPPPWRQDSERTALLATLPAIDHLPTSDWLRFWGLRQWSEGLSCYYVMREGASTDCAPLVTRLRQGGPLEIRLAATLVMRESLRDAASPLEPPEMLGMIPNDGLFIHQLGFGNDWSAARFILHLMLRYAYDPAFGYQLNTEELHDLLEDVEHAPAEERPTFAGRVRSHYESLAQEYRDRRPSCDALVRAFSTLTGHTPEGSGCAASLRSAITLYNQLQSEPLDTVRERGGRDAVASLSESDQEAISRFTTAFYEEQDYELANAAYAVLLENDDDEGAWGRLARVRACIERLPEHRTLHRSLDTLLTYNE